MAYSAYVRGAEWVEAAVGVGFRDDLNKGLAPEEGASSSSSGITNFFLVGGPEGCGRFSSSFPGSIWGLLFPDP